MVTLIIDEAWIVIAITLFCCWKILPHVPEGYFVALIVASVIILFSYLLHQFWDHDEADKNFIKMEHVFASVVLLIVAIATFDFTCPDPLQSGKVYTCVCAVCCFLLTLYVVWNMTVKKKE